MTEEEIFNLAEERYHTDVWFHQKVFRAVSLAVPKTVNESINTALQEVATWSASIVLVLKELDEQGLKDQDDGIL